jgi:uncharacterized LabA/DUF88 family protein
MPHEIDRDVTYRPLKYTYQWVNGHREIDPGHPPQEKGIDVLCALAMVRLAQTGIYDAVVLASRDTDLIPSLDEANRSDTHIEAVKWFKRDLLNSLRLLT